MKHMGRAIVAFAAAIGMALSGGAAAANADDYPDYNYDVKYETTNVKVSEVGAHTANVTFDWKVDTPVDQIKDVCAVGYIARVTDFAPNNIDSSYRYNAAADTGVDERCISGVADTDLTQETYKQIYGPQKQDLYLQNLDTEDTKLAATFTGQTFTRWLRSAWDGKSNSGTFTIPIIGLEPNITYGNTKLTDDWDNTHPTNMWALAVSRFNEWREQGGDSKDSVDDRQAYVGVHVTLKDGTEVSFDVGAAKIPDFTTTAEPTGTPESDLTDETKDNIAVDKGGTVTAGKSARVYINDLKEDCKGDKSCFWYGYIYSTPTKLTDPMGSPFLTVQKDDAGKYYVDAHIPDGLTGEHKIALTDEAGKLQGWTTVTVSKDGETKPDQPKPEAEKVPVYRLYNPGLSQVAQHLYTANKAEYDDLIANHGWQGEGVQFYTTSDQSAAPVYRVYNPYTSEHFLTSDKAEYENLWQKQGWQDDGLAWYIPADGTADVYRLRNKVTGEHLYTTNAAEKDMLTSIPDWVLEGVQYKAYAK